MSSYLLLITLLLCVTCSCDARDRVTIKINNEVGTQQQHGSQSSHGQYTPPQTHTSSYVPPLRQPQPPQNPAGFLLQQIIQQQQQHATPVPPVAAAAADASSTSTSTSTSTPTPTEEPLPPPPPPNFVSFQDTCFSTTIMPHVYTLCPFHNITQRLYHGDQQRVLGIWGTWFVHESTRDLIQVYTDGTLCHHSSIPAHQTKKRQTQVIYACGTTPSLSLITEPNICDYQITFYHPLSCELPNQPENAAPSLATPAHPDPDHTISSMQNCINVLWDAESTAKQQETACHAFTKTTTTPVTVESDETNAQAAA